MNRVVEVLRARDPIEVACRRAGVSVEEFRRERDAYLRSKLPPREERVAAAVRGTVEIARDRWSIPHVRAAEERDALLGLGYSVARDRLWQLDFLRREALGTLAELLGPEAHGSDLRMRTIGIDLIADREVAQVDDATRELVEGFVVGINRAMELTRGRWPVEFDLLDYEPSPWSLRDTIALLRGLWWQLTGRLENIVAAEAARQYVADESLYTAFMTPELPDERIIPAAEAYPSSRGASAVEAAHGSGGATGSNNWVVARERTTTGAALLASDPHLPFVNPSDLYEAHLVWPGHDVVGAHWAGAPGANWGYNGRIAWGLTNNAASARDLYVEAVDPDHPGAYRRAGQWRPFDTRAVDIAVRGEAPRRHEIRSTDLGPVMNATVAPVAEGGDPPLSMRWIGLEHIDDLKAMLAIQRAGDWAEFRAALADWSLPIWNWVYADRAGEIGYQNAGRVPLRGRVVRGYRDPEETADRWHVYVRYDMLPRLHRPKRGFHHTANNRVAPDDYLVPLHGAWAGGNRATRIRQQIEATERISPAGSRALQNDVYLIRAERMVPGLVRVLAGTRLGDVLVGWDYRYGLESAAPTVFEAVVHYLAERVVAARLPRRLVGILHGNGVALAARLVEGEAIDWFPASSVEAEVRVAAEQAEAFLRQRFGDDPVAWTWGRVHTITLVHPLASSNTFASDGQLGSDGPFPVGGPFAQVANVGPAAVTGTGDSVRNAAGRIDHDFQIVSGAEYRLLVDFAASPAALAINVLGQSGQPGSPHYGDQFADWVAGEYHPLLTDPTAVEQGATGRTTLLAR